MHKYALMQYKAEYFWIETQIKIEQYRSRELEMVNKWHVLSSMKKKLVIFVCVLKMNAFKRGFYAI